MADDAPSTVTMYGADGAPVQVPAAQVGDAYRSGQATFAADQDVPVVGEDGRIAILKGADAAAYLQTAQGGIGGVASGEQLRQQQLQDEYGGVGGQALAAGAGVLRGVVPLGLSDQALVALGGENMRTDLRGLQEANPWTSAGSELVGMGLGVAAGGALGAGGKLISGAGRAAEGLAATALGAETALARAGIAAAGAATEGALYGVGSAVSQAALQNTDLTAEKILAAAGHGALLGGVTGGGLSLAGSALRATGERAGGFLSKLSEKEGALAGDLAAAAPKTEAGALAMASRVEQEAAIKSTGANATMVKEIIDPKNAGMRERVVRMVAEDLPVMAGKQAGSIIRTAEEKATAAVKLVEDRGAKIGSLVDELAASGAKADVSALLSQQRQNVIKELATKVDPELKKAAKKIEETWFADIERKLADGDVKKLWETKRDLGKRIDWEAPASNAKEELKKNLYRSLDDEIKRVGDVASEKMGSDFAARWANSNAEYKAAAWLRDATAKGAERATSNRAFGLSEQLMTVGGAVLGAGGPVGIATGLAGAAISRLVKDHGADVAARVARAARQGELVGGITRAVDETLGKRAAQLVGAGKGLLSSVASGPRLSVPLASLGEREVKRTLESERKAVEDKRAQLAHFKVNRAVQLDAMTRGLEGAPAGVREAVQAKVARAADFLESKLPPAAPVPAGVPPHLARERKLSPEEVSKFRRYERAVDDPLSVLDDARKGTLTPEAIEAVKATSPMIFEAIRTEIGGRLAARTKPLSWKEQTQLNLLLDLPTSEHFEPAAMAYYQSVHKTAPAPNQPQTPQTPPRPLAAPMRAPSLASRTDSLGAEP